MIYEIDDETVNIIKVLLARATLKGEEVPAFLKALHALEPVEKKKDIE